MDKKENNRINETYKTALENIKNMVDVSSVIGEPIQIQDSTIIPITNISIFTLLGGGEYGKINLFNKNNNFPYSIGNSSFLNVKPVSFLIKNKGEEIKIINVANTDFEKIFDKVYQTIKDQL